MDDFLEKYAGALGARLGTTGRRIDLPGSTRDPLLTLARVVAHRTERKNAPLATYLAGLYAAGRAAEGIDAGGAIAEALEIAESVAPVARPET